LKRVFHAPLSFFDTTPLGRIMNRFSKGRCPVLKLLIIDSVSLDIDTIDNTLGEALRMLVIILAQIVGSVILIAIVLPWFFLAMTITSVIYWYMAILYSTSAREIKRLGESTPSSKPTSELNSFFQDAILRSSLYSHFSESLVGLSTIRAYGETGRFFQENIHRVDVENRYDFYHPALS
jgi:ABC-type multidrug transport system fused ATPase/permease subunit